MNDLTDLFDDLGEIRGLIVWAILIMGVITVVGLRLFGRSSADAKAIQDAVDEACRSRRGPGPGNR